MLAVPGTLGEEKEEQLAAKEQVHGLEGVAPPEKPQQAAWLAQVVFEPEVPKRRLVNCLIELKNMLTEYPAGAYPSMLPETPGSYAPGGGRTSCGYPGGAGMRVPVGGRGGGWICCCC